MTKPTLYNQRCHNCNIELTCENCKTTQKIGSKFSNWLRNQDEIDSKKGFVTTDIDYVWENYKENWFITIEEKTHYYKGQDYNWSQWRSIKCIIDKLTHGSDKQIGGSQYKGHYLIQFENKSPDDSAFVYINKVKHKPEVLLELLKFGELYVSDWW